MLSNFFAFREKIFTICKCTFSMRKRVKHVEGEGEFINKTKDI